MKYIIEKYDIERYNDLGFIVDYKSICEGESFRNVQQLEKYISSLVEYMKFPSEDIIYLIEEANNKIAIKKQVISYFFSFIF